MKLKIVVENVIATARLGHGVDLEAVAKILPEVKYDPKTFPGLFFRLRGRPMKVLVFRNGKMVCMGAKSEREALNAVRKVVRKLRDAGIIVRSIRDFTVHNIVAAVDLGASVDIEEAVYKLEAIMYEPEQFPGLIYRMEEPKTTFLIFHSGKLVCVGAKNEEDLHKVVKKLQKKLEEKGLVCVHVS